MYETAVHGGERLDFAQNEDGKVPQDDERKGAWIFIWNFWSRPALSIRWRLLWWQWFCVRRRWCRASTSKQRTRFPFHSTKNKKRENGEDIEQGSSLVIVLNQSKKNECLKALSYSWNVKCRIYCPWNVKRPFYFPRNVINTPPPPLNHPLRTVTCEWSGQCFQVCLFVCLGVHN